MAHTTKTVGPLHFEDLEPKRFEDLIRQLAYEFRVWRRLEATGRAGSDDGFDARGFEIVAGEGDSVPIGEEAEDQDDSQAGMTDRLWLIQCKRERQIGPKKLVSYLDEITLREGESLHGIVFAAACDFSKTAHDKYVEKCRQLGVRECYLWGKAALEDLLFQPKNDHLLFAYFGFSLSIRQRTIQATLRRDIATKKRLKTVVERTPNRVLIVRNAAGDMYPETPPRASKFAADHWRLCEFEQFGHEGLIVEFATYPAFFDGEFWDAADALGAERSHNHLGRTWQHPEENDPYDAALKLWDAFGEDRAWLRLLAVIPYNRILAIDDVGDEYFKLPQVYCHYEGRWPFSDIFASVERIGVTRDQKWVEPQDPTRVQRFPQEFRRQDAPAGGQSQQSPEGSPGIDHATPTTREE